MRRYIVRSGDAEPMIVSVVEHEDGYEFTIGEETFRVDSVSRPGSPTRSLLIDGHSFEASTFAERDGITAHVSGDAFFLKVTDELWARVEGSQASSRIGSLQGADLLLEIPAELGGLEAGKVLWAQLLRLPVL